MDTQIYKKSKTPNFAHVVFVLFLVIFYKNAVYAQALRDHTGNDKYIGNILNYQFFESPDYNPANYETILENEFNAIVAEDNMKMDKILETEPLDPFNLTLEDLNLRFVDEMVEWANNNIHGKMATRGHALIWFDQVPDWLKIEAANWTNDQIYDFTKSYIQLVIGYTNGKIDEWDVVNEAINVGSSGFRNGNDVWYRNVDDIQDYLEYCFVVAREADPANTTKLLYNDFNIEPYDQNTNSKNSFMRTMVQKMLDNNVPIDGVGMQSHFTNSQVDDFFINRVEKTIDEINGMGLICNLTELEIRICNAGDNPGQQQLTKQKESYKKIVEMAMSKPMTTGLVIWGFSDAHSWVPSTFPGCDHALLYDDDFVKKPTYTAVLEALQALYPVSSGADKPTAVFSLDFEESTAPQLINLDASASSDPNNKTLSYNWDFGDGTSSTAISPTHTYMTAGTFTIKLTVDNGSEKRTTRNRIVVLPEGVAQSAYKPHSIPGIIEAEDYDNGGEGISFSDSGSANIGEQGRLDQGVDIETISDDPNEGFNVGWTADGEWLEYTIGTITAGTYDLILRVASGSSDSKSIATKLGNTTYRTMNIPDTGGWKKFQDITISGVNVVQTGEQVFRLDIIGGNINIDKVIFRSDGPVTPTNRNPIANAGNDGTFTTANIALDGSNSSDSDGTIVSFIWSENGSEIATGVRPTVALSEGSHTITLTVTDDKGATDQDTVTVVINEETIPTPPTPPTNSQSAYVVHSIPGVIETENYDNGGQNVAYYDIDVVNNGGAGRTNERVDLEIAFDDEEGTNLGWTADGEWIEYTIGAITPGSYTVVIRAASALDNNKSLALSLGSSNLGSVTIPNTGGWQSWNDFSIANVEITDGSADQILRLAVSGGYYNINWIRFEKTAVVSPVTPTPPTTGNTACNAVQAEDHTENFYQLREVNGVMTNIGYSHWLKFDDIDVTGGKFTFRYSKGNNQTGYMEVRLDDNQASNAIAKIYPESTGDWDNFTEQTVAISGSGKHTVYLYFHNASTNIHLDWIQFGDGVDCDTKNGGKNLLKTTDEVLVYPNPSKGNVTIELPTATEVVSIILYDLAGRKVQTIETIKPRYNNLINLNTGIYLLKVQNVEKTIVRKLIIE